VSVRENGKNKHLGYFVDKESAAKAYDQKAKELYGESAILNFPEIKYEPYLCLEDLVKLLIISKEELVNEILFKIENLSKYFSIEKSRDLLRQYIFSRREVLQEFRVRKNLKFLRKLNKYFRSMTEL
jgi:hypothetical protein